MGHTPEFSPTAIELSAHVLSGDDRTREGLKNRNERLLQFFETNPNHILPLEWIHLVIFGRHLLSSSVIKYIHKLSEQAGLMHTGGFNYLSYHRELPFGLNSDTVFGREAVTIQRDEYSCTVHEHSLHLGIVRSQQSERPPSLPESALPVQNGWIIPLRKMEAKILYELFSSKGLISQKTLIQNVWYKNIAGPQLSAIDIGAADIMNQQQTTRRLNRKLRPFAVIRYSQATGFTFTLLPHKEPL